ncbi:MAG: hypothetical protein ACJ77I_01210, partial [Chloroflexota bacterium]
MAESGDRPIDAHAEHDPAVVASLLDRELTGPDRAAAARQVASCAACAALHADLRLLASATAALPAPVRTRDFRLTAADAASLRAPVAATADAEAFRAPVVAGTAAAAMREPLAAATRLSGEMPESREHAAHDTLLVAALADRTLSGAERERAEALVARCDRCAALRDDVVAIQTATVSLPTPPRVDDYQLSPDDAAG